jgi:glycolate oxidase
MADTLLSSLAEIYPADRILTDEAKLRRYERDAVTPVGVRPRAAVVARTAAEVIATVRLCHRLEVPFVARGTGSSLSGGSVPVAEGIVISLKEMNHLISLDPDSRIAVVEPGVVNLDVSAHGKPYNLRYAPDPSSQAFCTIGGNVAFNSGGAHCLKYGMTSNHVLALEVVLADGEVVTLGGESLEGVGPDLTALFVGSEGLFGIALKITLRLLPRVETYRTVLAAYRTLEEAGNAVSAVVASGMLPGALEIMDPLAIEATEQVSHAGYPLDAGAVVIVELEGDEQQVEAEFATLLDLIDRSGAYQSRSATSESEREAIWKGRKVAFTAVRRLSRHYIVQDGVVPRGKLGAALAEIQRLSGKYGIPVANVFHAGDGNLHPLILYEAEGVTASVEEAEELAGEILEMCIAMGGSITGEHGVGLEKRAYLPRMYGSEEMAAMVRMRAAMDSRRIANPGKMLMLDLPEAPEPANAAGQEAGATAGGVMEPTSLEEVREAVLSAARVVVSGAGTKPALSRSHPGAALVRTAALRGIIDYEPNEYTFTALAGTPVSEVIALLAQHDQYLPFDPPLSEAGATLGGVVASGLAGPRRLRYGGIRDFLIGTRFVDGHGRVVRGGGRVVKNAAGFDFPKLLVGSLGRLAVMVELTFKVFPSPPDFATLSVGYGSLEEAVDSLSRISRSSIELDALELVPDGSGARLWIRIGGLSDQLQPRLERLRSMAGDGETTVGAEERALWAALSEMRWAGDGCALAKIPINPSRLAELDRGVADLFPLRRYSVGGHVAWLSGEAGGGHSRELDALETRLCEMGLAGLVIKGDCPGPLIGSLSGRLFRDRVLSTFDPAGRFGGYEPLSRP